MMKLLGLLSETLEFIDIMVAFALLIYMWIRSHRHLKKKINKLDIQLEKFDIYSSKKFSEIMRHLNEISKDNNDKGGIESAE